ncbi:MAG TPA: family 10 glycosylhydrolase [Phycisphaerae bacterium]|nr:family 10 glycosylhydrolase [Phycisphaerae bacterium]HOM50900.1 family 10 glycosylhydrolase [Phycisphaerae bacterium]HPP25925.1 family 10 glycosylhydrolase [Phycisphaerae bacterium]HQE29666.1 family 10 glycosylhydrolase [Phycisphaerae bacterium]
MPAHVRGGGSVRSAFVSSLFAGFLVGLSAVQAAEYRAMWVDAWGAGMHSKAEVEKLLGKPGDPNSKGDLREANCNTLIVQVRRRADVAYPSGMGEPYMSGLSPSNFNALQAILDAAHDTTGGKQRIDVHCWLVTFSTEGGLVWSRHSDPSDPENYWATEDPNGAWSSERCFDPGHPKCLEYLTNVAMDLVNNFDIDGIHWDYIRFTGNNYGYNPTSIARYNTRYGLTGKPSSSSEQFKQWRRDQVTALVRRVYAKIQATKPHVMHSGSFVTWNPSPSSSTRSAFQATRPYYDVYSDWDAWMQEGIMDIGVPMVYYNHASLPNDYIRWINFIKDRAGDRHMIIGPGIYLNSLDNALTQLLLTRTPSPAGNYAHGFSGYSYRVPYNGGSWAGFSPRFKQEVTPTPDTIPVAPWKTNPTKGHISGTVTYHGSGEWADHATVSISGPVSRTMYVDGTGFYAFIDVPVGTYTITARKAGYPDAIATVNVQLGQVTGNMYIRDLELGATNLPPAIFNVNVINIDTDSATITWTTDQAASSQVEYGPTTDYGYLTPLDSTPVTSHAVTLSGLTANTVYNFRLISANENGTTTSDNFTFTTSGPPTISNVQVTSITTNSATVTWTTNAPATSRVRYGLTQAYGHQTPLSSGSVTSHAVTITGLSANTTYHCQAVSTNQYGIAESADVTFSTADPAQEIIIDNLDPGFSGTGWSVGSLADVMKIGTNYLYTSGTGNTSEASITRTARWTPDIPGWGVYDVYVFYQLGTNRTTGAHYKIVHADGQLVSVQNQNSSIPNQGGWFLIGENLRFAPGTDGYVELGNNTPDTLLVSADAAKFVYKGADPTPPTVPVVTDSGDYSSSWNSLQASWSATDDETGISRYEYRIVQAGGPVVRDWTDAGTDTSVTATNLPLLVGAVYIWEVRAINGAGVVSETGVSDGIRIFTFDANDDGKVNELDASLFAGCLSGEGIDYPQGSTDCGKFDANRDGDVDMEDYGKFQLCLNGSTAADPNCVTP